MIKHKIIFTGTVTSEDKEAAIACISDIETVSVSLPNSLNTNIFVDKISANADEVVQSGRGIKSDEEIITVNYGELALNDNERLRLYGTPDCGYFSLLWRVGAKGFVIFIDSSRKNSMVELKLQIKTLKKLFYKSAVVICITGLDKKDLKLLEVYTNLVAAEGIICPVIQMNNIRNKKELLFVLDLLLNQFDM